MGMSEEKIADTVVTLSQPVRMISDTRLGEQIKINLNFPVEENGQ